MTCLYTAEEAQRLKHRARRSAYAAAAAFALAFAACVTLCFFVRTANASRMLAWVIGVSALGGWAAILLLNLGCFPARAEYAHMEGILAGEEEEHTGRAVFSEGAFHIPKSITVRKVILTEGDAQLKLNVLDRKAHLLPSDGRIVRVRTVRNYITACEVLDEKD